MVLIFLPLTLYLIDVYTVYSASVLAASSVLRSLFGVGKLPGLCGYTLRLTLLVLNVFSFPAFYHIHVSGSGCTLGISSRSRRA